MYTKKFLLVFFILMGLFLVSCSEKQQFPVTAEDQQLNKVTITSFTYTNYPTGMTGEGTVKLEGGNWIMKDMGVIEALVSTDPLGGGTMTHYLSAVFDAVTGEGPVHGRFSIQPQGNTEGGIWEGNYTGYRSKKPGSDTLYILPLKGVGHGRGGTIDGMQLQINCTITAWGTPPTGWYGSGDGFYKSHEN